MSEEKMVRIIIAAFLLGYTWFVHAVTLKQVLVGGTPTQTNLDLILDSSTYPKIFRLNNPSRIVVDLPTTRLHPYVVRTKQFGSYTIRSGQFSSSITRVVIQCAGNSSYRLEPMRLQNEYRIRLVLNETPYAASTPIVDKPPVPSGSMISRWGFQHNRKVVVVIDPGHGGKDPGASGYHRTLEKHVVLAIAKKLQQKINRQSGMVAVLTRDGDYFIDLRRRLDISRRYHADIFVAIHADAFTNTQSHGASVFALSQRGATSEAARWLAEKENYSELGGVNLKDLDDKNGMVRSVLIDLSQTATIQAGLKMGTNVLRNLGGITSLHNHKVEQARFVVLKSPDTPSILVETGFISNPNEEQRLASAAYQEQLSQAIFNGIYQYFREYPPRGTQFR
jgi:N-acetylmuramoyl-L-alanine amidase